MKHRKGFTLVEMLVVIIIMSILASLTVVAVMSALTSSKVSNTEVMLDTIKAALAQYQVRWGDYPPSTLAEMRIPVPNDTNNGIEALVACLASRDKGGILYTPPSEELYCNCDEDQLARNPNNWFFGDTKLRELRDYFGTPLTYLHFRDYAKPAPSVTRYVLEKGKPPRTIKAVRSGATGAYVNPDKFQVSSPGRDGEYGTKDDIVK